MKLYVIVRNDLTNSQRAVQAGHVVAEFLLRGPSTEWKNGTLVYLGVDNLFQLEKLKYQLTLNDISFVEFKEPDIDHETTAIATDKYSKKFKKLNLL